MTRALAILTVRNEGAFLLDWIAHHRAVGFTDFLVFSNDCQDGTDAMLDRLAALGQIVHVPNPGPHDKGPQWSALAAADRHPLRAAAEWVLVLDIDEFVNIHAGEGRLADLWAAVPAATAIPLTWRLFGNAGVVAHEDRPLPEIFTRAAPRILLWPWRAALFKTLFRDDGSYGKLGVHRPRAPDPARLAAQRWVDGSGRPLPDSYHRAGIFSDYRQDNHRLVQLNHYPLGAMESYIVKCDRGRANRTASAFDMSYWVERNFGAEEDTSISRLTDRARPLRAEFAADPVLGPLHDRAVAWRRARFESLMAQEDWRSLFGRLLITPESRPPPADQAARLLRWGLRARADHAGVAGKRLNS